MNATTNYACDDCMLTITGRPTDLLPSGAPDRRPGDSGAPVIVNDTAHGGTAIPGLFANTPFVVGFGSFGVCYPGVCSENPWLPGDDVSVVSWDTTFGPNDPIGTGTFIQSHLSDWDQDGVPDAVDNCLVAPNPDQANCNAEAESARGFEARGDACDPIPCAALAPTEGTLVGTWAFLTTFLDLFGGTVIHDRIVVEPQGSHYYSSGAQNHTLLPEVSAGAVPTHYRYCQPDANAEVLCDESVMGHNEYLTVPPAAPPDPSRSWLPVTMRTTGSPSSLVGDQELISYPAAASRQRRWDYRSDFDDWLANGWISSPIGCGSVLCCYQGDCITGLNGTFWARSSTTKGTAANPAHGAVSAFLPPNTGFRPKGGAPSSDDLHLSNSYLPLKPDSIFIRTFGKPLAPWPYFFWRWSWPDPAPRPWFDLLRQDTFLMPLDQGHVGLLLADGKAVVADELVGRPLMAALADPDTRWVDAVEPMLHTVSPTMTSAIQLVGLSADGTRMTSLVTRENANGCVPPSDTMIGWWPLDDDASDGAPLSPWHDGTFHRQVDTAPGHVGEAASFPKPGLFKPASYVKVENPDGAFDLANDFTVEAWVYPTQFQLAPQELVGRGAAGWRIGILPFTKTLYAGKGLQVIATPVQLTAKEWQHVAVSFTPIGTVFYVNGARVYTDTSSLGTRDIHYHLSSNKPVTFGAGADLLHLGARPFVGRLDEVSIYDKALTDAEIAAIADAGSAGKCKSPAVTELPLPAPGPAPAPRADYTAVFSRAENALFVLGGKDLVGAPLHDLWMQRIEPPGKWTELLPASYEPGEVLDAVWSYADHRLWILDSQVIDGIATVRLVRIEPYLGTTQVLGQWPAEPSVLGRWLGLDRDGQVLLIATSAERYGVVRVEVVPFEDALPTRPLLAVRDGRLAFRPLVDASGYSFVRKSNASDDLNIDCVAELALARSGLADLEPALAPGR
jgi:hypothetical protein